MKSYIIEKSCSLLSVEDLNEHSRNGEDLIGFNKDESGWVYIFCKECIDNVFSHANIQQAAIPPVQTPKRFMFKTAVMSLGVSQQTAEDWIKVRQTKKAAQTETAFNRVRKNVEALMSMYGVSAEDIVKVAVIRDWKGVEVSFYDNVKWSDYDVQQSKTDLFSDIRNSDDYRE